MFSGKCQLCLCYILSSNHKPVCFHGSRIIKSSVQSVSIKIVRCRGSTLVNFVNCIWNIVLGNNKYERHNLHHLYFGSPGLQIPELYQICIIFYSTAGTSQTAAAGHNRTPGRARWPSSRRSYSCLYASCYHNQKKKNKLLIDLMDLMEK